MDLKNLDNIKVPEELDELKGKLYRDELYSKKAKKFRYSYVATTLAFVFVLGMAFPKYTRDLPLYNNIFELFGDENYQSASEHIDEEVVSNGVSIRLVDAVYSNNEVSLTTIIKMKEPIGENVALSSDLAIKNFNILGMTGNSGVKYMGNGIYISESKMNIDFKEHKSKKFAEKADKIKVKYKIDGIFNYETKKEIKGNWKFDIELENLKSDVYVLNNKQKQNGIYLNIDRIEIDDVGTNFKFSWWNDLELDAMINQVDDIYLVDPNGNSFKLEQKGIWGNKDIVNSEAKFSKKIDTDQDYILKLTMRKSDIIGYNEHGKIEKYEIKDRTVYEKIPNVIEFEIPINLKK